MPSRRRTSSRRSKESSPAELDMSTSTLDFSDVCREVEPDLSEICTLVQIELHREDAEAVLVALERLTQILPGEEDELTSEWEALKQDFIWNGTVPTMIQIMRKWKHNDKIQQLVCHWLASFDYNCDNQAGIPIAKAGGFEATINALITFPNSEDVHQNGWALLNRLFWNLEEEQPAEIFLQKSQSFVEEWKGLLVVTQAMTHFSDNAPIQHFGCRLLHNLSRVAKYRRYLVRAGAATAVSKAVEKHPQNDDVGRAANDFVKTLYRTGGD